VGTILSSNADMSAQKSNMDAEITSTVDAKRDSQVKTGEAVFSPPDYSSIKMLDSNIGASN